MECHSCGLCYQWLMRIELCRIVTLCGQLCAAFWRRTVLLVERYYLLVFVWVDLTRQLLLKRIEPSPV